MLSMHLMMEMGRWRPDTAALAREAAQQAAYCLDAPDDMPAGSMVWDSIGDTGFPMPTSVEREA
jgi:hypothetical protein